MDDTDLIRRGDAPERIWIEDDECCPYHYVESELAEAGGPLIEYIRADLAAPAHEPPSPGVTAGATGAVSDADFLRDAGIDGAKWAAGFKAVAERLGHHGMDEGWLIGWFCNAIMAGYDEAERRHRAATPAPVVPAEGLDALIDLIGEFGREVYYLLDDCETSGPVGKEVHTITDDGLMKVSALLDRIDALPFEEPGVILGPGAMLQTALKQTITALRSAPPVGARVTDDAAAFDRADWFWRTMDPDDCGDSPEEAISRAMVGQFCVCEIASSYHGPTRYGFIAPVLDPASDDEEFVHFATQQEAVEAAKARRAALLPAGEVE